MACVTRLGPAQGTARCISSDSDLRVMKHDVPRSTTIIQMHVSCGPAASVHTLSAGSAVTTHLLPLEPSLYPRPNARPLRTLPSVRTAVPLLLFLAPD